MSKKLYGPSPSVTGSKMFFGARKDGRLLMKLPEFSVLEDTADSLRLSADGIVISFDKKSDKFSAFAEHLCVPAVVEPVAPTVKARPAPVEVKKLRTRKYLVGAIKVYGKYIQYPVASYMRFIDGSDLFVSPILGKFTFAELAIMNTNNALLNVHRLSQRIVIENNPAVLSLLNAKPSLMLLLDKDSLTVKKELSYDAVPITPPRKKSTNDKIPD